MTKMTNVSDKLLSEIERQQKYLDKLPEEFKFPLFNSKQAFTSQRRSGYRTTASAAREIVDNAIEAGAKNVHVAFELPAAVKKNQRKNSVTAVAFIDDGPGMLPQMARYALSWGSGTHTEEPDFIGKFGFGLPNASINQTKRVEVYTKTVNTDVVSRAVLDANDVEEHGLQTIGEPEPAELPGFVQKYLDDEGLQFKHGTIVVWQRPDLLAPKTKSVLIEHLRDDFAVTYRYLLDRHDIYIDGKPTHPVDPLFLTPGALFYTPTEKGGADTSMDRNFQVTLTTDPSTDDTKLVVSGDDAEELPEGHVVVSTGAMRVRVARFPYGFAAEGAKGKDAKARFEIRKPRRGMSFVRADREIETVDVFPKSIKDKANGLGNWPLLQGYAYHWGAEVRFTPELDEVFGITNDKQTVRPIEEFWRLLADEEVDKQLRAENAHQVRLRHEEKQRQHKEDAETKDVPTRAERASSLAQSAAGQRVRPTDLHTVEAQESFNSELARRVDEGAPTEDARVEIEAENKKRPYVVRFAEREDGPFYWPKWEQGTQLTVYVNKLHPFFEVMYGPLIDQPKLADAKEALDVMLIALADGEMRVDEETCATWYKHQREKVWSSFLERGLTLLGQDVARDQVDDEPETGMVDPEDEAYSHAAE